MSMIIGKALIAGGGTAKRLEFEYTGTYNERLDDGVVELLTSGVLTFKKDTIIDAFLVGGGGSGGSADYDGSYGGGGGGGGYTTTQKNFVVTGKTQYPIVVGSGGPKQTTRLKVGNSGGDTTAFGFTASGGRAYPNTAYNGSNGNYGGSGGGAAGANSSGNNYGGVGGSDGSDGANQVSNPGGKGQGTTTREFGESTGKLYSGGGGGGPYSALNDNSNTNHGGEGGGGRGGWTYAGTTHPPTPGTDGLGGGGGGGICSATEVNWNGAAGGSGIVCIRLHKEA